MAVTKRQLEQKAFEINYLRQQAQQIEGQMQLVQRALIDIDATKAALAVTGQLKDGTMIPMGSGVFAKAKAENTEKVLIDVGARVLLEKTPQEASAILDGRKTALEKNMGELATTFERVAGQINQLSVQAEKMAQQVQDQ